MTNQPVMPVGQVPQPGPQPMHVVHFTVPVSHRSIQLLQDRILCALERGATQIQLRISSPGGALDAGFAAYGVLTSLPVSLHTHNNGNVESVAVPMYLAGRQRTAAPHSRFLVHPLHWGHNGVVDHPRISEWASSLDFDRERYCTIFREATQGAEVPLDIEECLRDRAQIIGAASAASHGITTAAADRPQAARAVMLSDHVLPRENVVHWWVNGF